MSVEVTTSTDTLRGAANIAAFLFGPGRAEVRRVYYLVSKNLLPVYHCGSSIYARRSTLAAWIEKQEQANSQPSRRY